MAIQLWNKDGDFVIVDNVDVQTMIKAGWKFKKPAVKVCDVCSGQQCICETETEKTSKTTKRRKATLRIEKAEAEVLKPNKEENDG